MPRAPDPPCQVRAFLAISMRNGCDFESAWASAVQRTIFPHDRDARHEYVAALQATKAAFQAAYEGRPVPGGPQLRGLVDALAKPNQTSWIGSTSRRTWAA